jgi:hypothetical protein
MLPSRAIAERIGLRTFAAMTNNVMPGASTPATSSSPRRR